MNEIVTKSEIDKVNLSFNDKMIIEMQEWIDQNIIKAFGLNIWLNLSK